MSFYCETQGKSTKHSENKHQADSCLPTGLACESHHVDTTETISCWHCLAPLAVRRFGRHQNKNNDKKKNLIFRFKCYGYLITSFIPNRFCSAFIVQLIKPPSPFLVHWATLGQPASQQAQLWHSGLLILSCFTTLICWSICHNG